MTRLKVQTLEAHRALEANLPLLRPTFTLGDYHRLLTQWSSVVVPLEEKLAALPLSPALRLSERLKSHLLKADMDFLGSQFSTLPPSPIPALDEHSALGALYVLEGSTLGGQLISRHLRDSLGITPQAGGEFFYGYGPQTGPMWKDFSATLEGLVPPQQEEAVIGGALQVFQAFQRALGPLEVVA